MAKAKSVKNLVIVESPGKIKTISQVLGKDYSIAASMGHVRDLPKSKMGIDVDHGFKPEYLISKDKQKVVKELKSKISADTIVWLATDEDREGEAIGWHLLEALNLGKKNDVKRIVFHEITRPAILEAIENPRQINMKLVNAQQARRVLDRLVGYELSPLLWKKIRYGLSAGRVQSVAVRLVVEREREIEAFKPEEYWSITAKFETEEKALFEAQVISEKGKNLKITNGQEAERIVKALKGSDAKVLEVEQKEVHRSPAPPFTTSTLQQEAARKLGFSVKKTMMVAQKLYEGIEVHGEHQGLITYMRTDSVNLSELALKQAREVVQKEFGKEYALETPRRFKGRKGAQEAHEAIRPTDLSRHPQTIKSFLDKDALKLYELIWKRALASQMALAVFDQVRVNIEAGDFGLKATGQTLRFAGFIAVYREGRDEEDNEDDENLLPSLKEGDPLDLKELLPAQHFTKPPARYTEASLVKKLEEEGIGRPSTYAPTISTVLARGYIQKEAKALKPTDLAYVVNDFLVEHFPRIVDYKFTARMEDMLDEIEEGKEKWQEEIKEFYGDFHTQILDKQESVRKEDVIQETTDEMCELCGRPMQVKLGRYGKFLSCTGFPDCKNAKPMEEKEAASDPQAEEELAKMAEQFAKKTCPNCGSAMEVKKGRFGFYLACTKYPECKTTESINVSLGISCPECKEGELVERKTRRGKPFYGCNRYPKCKFAVWEKPKDSAHALELREQETAKASKTKAKSKGKKTKKAS